MKTPSLLGWYLLGLSLLACGTLGCGAGAGSGTRTPGNVDEAREHEARRALVAAREADSIEAFETVTKKYEGTPGGEQARMELARRAAELARAAIGRGDRDEARVMAVRALEFGDPVLAQQATTTLQQVDLADARETAERVEAVLHKDSSLVGCEKAVMLVANTFGPEPSKLLVSDLRKATLQPLANCLQSAIDAGSADASFGAVRKVVEGSETEQVLGPDMRFSVLSALNDQVV
ncbi:MAG: hypothetical protein MUF54_20195, partial [Polyangiaceae bacterium]|nr:hypothetical protein [Polyangiaceae bacterium]